MVFDARRAKALPAGEHIIVEDAPGLRLVASATRRAWTYRFKSPIDGRMRQVALGQWPAMSYAAAFAAWQDLRAQRDAGQDPALAKREAVVVQPDARVGRGARPYLVRDLIEDFLQGHVELHRKPKGQKEARRLMLGADYTGAILDVRPEQLKRAQAFKLLEDLGKRAPVLANTLRTDLGAAWEYALDAGRIEEETPNWWRQLLRGKLRSRGKIVDGAHQGRELRHLEGAEVGQLIRWLPNFTELIDDLLTLYLWTGCRGAELVQMEGAEVQQEADGWWWTVPKRKLKMERHAMLTDLRVPLVGRALAVVQRRVAVHGAGYLFPARQRGGAALQGPAHVEQKVVGVAAWAVRPDTVTDRLPAGRAKVLHLRSWAPHDLRRTVKTTLASMGCPEPVSEAVLGHMPAGIAGVYNRHSYDKERREWLTRLAAHWERLAAQ